MQIAFLIIISLIAGSYALWTKQSKVGFGFLILAAAFFISMPNITTGFWESFLSAASLILFALGSFVIIWKKKDDLEKKEDKDSKTE